MIKIQVCGFPHCGTSILKSIIGHIDQVYEILDEVIYINQELYNIDNSKKYILGKDPL